jgi:biopolymer transport protein ExbD
MHGAHLPEDEPMSEMNFIPLIDIALTLVIILMVTTAFIQKPGVSLNLPKTATREGAPETPKDLVINVAKDGVLYVDGGPRKPAEVQQRLLETAKTNPNARVMVKGDRDVVYARVMDVMDMVRQAGLTRIVLPTDPKGPGYYVPPTPAPKTPASAGAVAANR